MANNLQGLDEQGLRALQRQVNAQVNALREQGKVLEARELRQEVLRIAAAADELQLARYAEAQRKAEATEGAQSTMVDANAADAVSEAERIIHG